MSPRRNNQASPNARNVSFLRNSVSHPSTREIMDNRRAESTRDQYLAAIERIKAVITDRFPDRVQSIMDEEGYLLNTVPLDVYKIVLETLSRRFHPNGEITMLSQSSFTTAGTSFVYWHEISQERFDNPTVKIALTEDHKKFYSEFAKGRKRLLAMYRNHGLITKREGKQYLSFSGYRLLAKKALLEAKSSKESLLAHAFTIIGWNLMARSVTVAPLLWNSVGWVGDCLTITYETSKTNQEGLHVVPRHLFANPVDPLICPVLALGLKLIHESDITDGVPSRIFYGSSGNQRYSQWLKSRLDLLTDEEVGELGSPAADIGTHSLRKGAATYVCGLTNGPHSDSVKLRMDHTIGSTDDRYIHIQGGIDKLVGRCVSGLDSNSDDFCYLPPVFTTFEGVSFANVLPDGRLEDASASLKAAIPFLIASVVYHTEWLENNLPRNHPFFSSKIYRGGFCQEWKDKIKLYKRHCPETNLVMSGVPAYAQITREIVELKEKVETNHKETQENFESMPQKVGDYILSRIGTAHGVQISNEETIRRVIRQNFPDIGEMINYLRNFVNNNRANESMQVPLPNPATSEFAQFEWGNAIHYVPADFMMPQENVTSLWRLWIFGCKTNRLRPLRFLQGSSLMIQSQRTQLSKARFVMNFISNEADKTFDEIHAIGVNEAEKLCRKILDDLLGHLNGHIRMCYSNVYIHFKRIEKRRNES